MRRIKTMESNARYTRDQISIGYRNTLKCSKGRAESSSHKNMKYLIAKFLWEHSLSFQTEATWKNGVGRCDIVCEEWKTVFEILESEETKTFNKKSYPLLTIPVRTNEDPIELEAMLTELFDTGGTAADWYVKRQKEKINHGSIRSPKVS